MIWAHSWRAAQIGSHMISTYTRMHAHIHKLTQTCTHTHTYTHAHTYTHTYVYTCTCTRTHVHTHTHTHLTHDVRDDVPCLHMHVPGLHPEGNLHMWLTLLVGIIPWGLRQRLHETKDHAQSPHPLSKCRTNLGDDIILERDLVLLNVLTH